MQPDEQPALLPEGAHEPKPWYIRVWRYGSYVDEFYAFRNDAVDALVGMADWADCFVEGLYRDGVPDEEGNRRAFPWRYRDPNEPRGYTGQKDG